MAPGSRLLLLVAGTLLPHAIKLFYYPDYPGFDDAFIHMRIADNVALGKGWGVIGMLAYYSRDRYRLVDSPGLTTPSMVGLAPREILRHASARFVVEH